MAKGPGAAAGQRRAVATRLTRWGARCQDHALTSTADASGVPRRHSRTVRGYPESVSEPSPKSVPTKRTSRLCHETDDLASGSTKPPSSAGMNLSETRSNSRTTVASAPPRDR